MATKATVNAIHENLKAIVSGLGSLQGSREATKEDVRALLGQPVYFVGFKGVAFENTTGERPAYDTSDFEVTVKFNHATLSEAYKAQIDVLHDLKDAVTIAALNVSALSLSKLVSRVTVARPQVDFNPPETVIKVTFSIRYREG